MLGAMNRAWVKWPPLWISLLIVGIFSLLYWYTRVQIHTFDALSYTHDVESKPFIELYHPHHLLYGPLGRIIFESAQGFGYEGRADAPIQALNAFAGALGVMILWHIGRQWTQTTVYSLAIACLMGVCYAYWLYASEVEVYTVAALFILLTIWGLGCYRRGVQQCAPTHGIVLGLTCAGAVMFHQTNSLLILPVSLFLAFHDPQHRIGYLLRYWITLAIAVGVPYSLVGYASGFRSPDAYYTWLTDYAQTGVWGGNINGEGLRALREGLLDTVSPHPLAGVLFYGGAVLGFTLGWRQLSWGWRAFCLSWLLLYGGFFWWWEPWNIEFWISLLPLWALGWLALGQAFLATNHLNSSAKYALQIAPMLLVGAIIAGQYSDLRRNADSDHDYYQQVTLALQPQLAPTDLVLTRGNILDLYLPFYAEHPPSQVLSLRNTPWEAIWPQLDHAYRRGQIIYLDSLLLDTLVDAQNNPFGLTEEQLEVFRPLPIIEAIQYEEQTVFYSIGQRSAPSATAWRFDNQLHGWLEFGASDLSFELGSWCFTGGDDPWIESPPLQLNADDHPTVEITMLFDMEPNGPPQLFWRHAEEGWDEARSLKFTSDGGLHLYTLTLAGQTGWTGDIVGLRFDPRPGGTDLRTCLAKIEFP